MITRATLDTLASAMRPACPGEEVAEVHAAEGGDRRNDHVIEGDEDLLMLDDAARLAGLSTKTLRRAITDGDLAARRVNGVRKGMIAIARPDLEAWLVRKEAARTEPGESLDMRDTMDTAALSASGPQAEVFLAIVGRLEEEHRGHLASKDQLIAELRRRAEAAELELAAVRRQLPRAGRRRLPWWLAWLQLG